MPGFATHYLFGISTMQKQKHTPLYAQIRRHPTVYGLGLQGPDIFFYYLPSYFSRRENPGVAAHGEKTGRFLYHLMEGRKIFTDKEDLAIASAYIAGFLGHYTLDTTCHPYVYGRTHYDPDDSSYFGRHVYLETDIDAFLLAQYKKQLPSAFHQERTIQLYRNECRVVAALLQYAYAKVFPELQLSYHSMYAAIRFMAFAVWVLYDPQGKKKALTRLAEKKIIGFAYASPLIASDDLRFTTDPMNLQHKMWRNPWKKSDASRDSFFDLMHQAKMIYQKRLALCEKLFNYDTCNGQPFPDRQSCRAHRADLKKELGNRSYSSGLEL